VSLRAYQQLAIERLRASVQAGHRAVVLVLPTGGGKTRVGATIIRAHIALGGRVLFLAHRRELIGQSAVHLRAEGLDQLRVIQAGGEIGPHDAPVTVASIQTLTMPGWMRRLPPATMVVIDECHHTMAETWARLATSYASALIIGLTATPQRSDGKPLGDIFTDLVVAASMQELIDEGHLVPCEVFAPPKRTHALASDPADAYLEYGRGRPGVVFCSTVAHAISVAESMTAAGVPAAHVDGKMAPRDRADRLARLARGELRVVTNVMVLTEGWDFPGVEVCILARSCEHASLYLQMVGRALRPAPGKMIATIVDLRGVVHHHGLPAEPRSYSLDGEAISQAEKLPPLQSCRDCGSVFRPAPQCPVCGVVRPMPELPEVKRQRLQQVYAKHTPDQRAAARRHLQAMAASRGYKPGWVDFVMQARYGAIA